MTLRQEVTSMAREYAQCPDAERQDRLRMSNVRKKAIKAVVLSNVINAACRDGAQSVELTLSTDPRLSFLGPVEEAFKGQCEVALDSYGATNPNIVRLFGKTVRNTILANEDDRTAIMNTISMFAHSGTSFSVELINLVQMAFPGEEPEEIYKGLRTSYSGVAKKFTGGKSFHTLNLANSGIGECPMDLKGYVQKDGEEEYRLAPGIISEAARRTPRITQVLYRHYNDFPDYTALCPGSVEVYGSEIPTATESTWAWVVDAAQSSRYIERVRELGSGA